VRGLLSAVRKTNAFGVVLGCVNNAISFAPANTHEALSRSNTYRSRPKRLCRCFSSARDSCTEASGASVGVKRTGCGVVVEKQCSFVVGAGGCDGDAGTRVGGRR
jgi:hypothetical protein